MGTTPIKYVLVQHTPIEGATAREVMFNLKGTWFYRPTLEEMFNAMSEITGTEIDNPDDYVAAMIRLGHLKQVQTGGGK